MAAWAIVSAWAGLEGKSGRKRDDIGLSGLNDRGLKDKDLIDKWFDRQEVRPMNDFI
jgi:hypothetical protein